MPLTIESTASTIFMNDVNPANNLMYVTIFQGEPWIEINRGEAVQMAQHLIRQFNMTVKLETEY